ncbi:hypothetical protein EV141_1688 [Microcella putealis]|uniref:Uncharacterized protein n=1 Tax=Microcella putealis TaxID=337005 RepID=A0A4Q7LNB2_9MICO|nr:hypothetical protein EV141_1688 [Microcella putealis]TQM27279.1 hypothetical protein BJ957_0714 [Microcella putealis]
MVLAEEFGRDRWLVIELERRHYGRAGSGIIRMFHVKQWVDGGRYDGISRGG